MFKEVNVKVVFRRWQMIDTVICHCKDISVKLEHVIAYVFVFCGCKLVFLIVQLSRIVYVRDCLVKYAACCYIVLRF